ncbi:transposase [Comamonas sp. Y33R10-2]|nr:transposase [Comamonas sp. Y33R10-2]
MALRNMTGLVQSALELYEHAWPVFSLSTLYRRRLSLDVQVAYRCS